MIDNEAQNSVKCRGTCRWWQRYRAVVETEKAKDNRDSGGYKKTMMLVADMQDNDDDGRGSGQQLTDIK